MCGPVECLLLPLGPEAAVPAAAHLAYAYYPAGAMSLPPRNASMRALCPPAPPPEAGAGTVPLGEEGTSSEGPGRVSLRRHAVVAS